jgi:thiopeptide-type bacteriocin biosynthesis protein
MEYEWLSAHLFYNSTANWWLTQFIQPFIKDVQYLLHPSAPYFFIRYNEGGPHIRLRMQVTANEMPALKEILVEQIKRFLIQHPVDISNRLLQKGAVLQYIPYLRETNRYGHTGTITLAERQFYLSAHHCLYAMEAQPTWDAATALTVAFQMHIAFFHALAEDGHVVTNICEQFITAWLNVISGKKENTSLPALLDHMDVLYTRQSGQLTSCAMQLWIALDAGRAPGALQRFSDEHRSLLQEYKQAGLSHQQLQYAIRSLLHMTHNRLGIINKEEPWCIYITHRSLQYIYEHIR